MTSATTNMTHGPLDVICLGRAAVDFYGNQIGSRLEDTASFAKYLGGSSGNIAYGCARLGLKSAMLTRVGDEHMGRFVREELARGGVDVSHVVTDPDRFTGLVVLGIKDRDTFPLIFFRNDCADMAIEVSDFSADFIASSKSLLITGTHFSTPKTFAACARAIEYARAAGVKVIVDIDYRPVLWGLTGLGDGETRYIDSDTVSAHLQTIWPDCDLIVGTEEEIHIAGGSTDTIAALRHVRTLTDATIVLKLGEQGCAVLDGEIPASLDDVTILAGPKIEVLNVLGAGDAFMSGFLRGWLRNESHESCANYANACGALVVSRHGCSPAIPSAEELDYYLDHSQRIPRPDLDEELNYLHRATTRRPRLLARNLRSGARSSPATGANGPADRRRSATHHSPETPHRTGRGDQRGRSRSRRNDRRYHRRYIRPGRPERRHRPRLVDCSPRGTVRVATAGAGRRPFDRRPVTLLAARAYRQVPAGLRPGRRKDIATATGTGKSRNSTRRAARQATSCCWRSCRPQTRSWTMTPVLRCSRAFTIWAFGRTGGSCLRSVAPSGKG